MPSALNLHLYSKRKTSLNRTLIRLRDKFAYLSQFQKYFHNKVNVYHFLQTFKKFNFPGTPHDMTKLLQKSQYEPNTGRHAVDIPIVRRSSFEPYIGPPDRWRRG